jgi:hypothetical protein
MNFIRVEDTDEGRTFVDLNKVEAVAVKVVRTPEIVRDGGFEESTMIRNPAIITPASEVIVVTLTAAGRQYTLQCDDATMATNLLKDELKIKVPFGTFE